MDRNAAAFFMFSISVIFENLDIIEEYTNRLYDAIDKLDVELKQYGNEKNISVQDEQLKSDFIEMESFYNEQLYNAINEMLIVNYYSTVETTLKLLISRLSQNNISIDKENFKGLIKKIKRFAPKDLEKTDRMNELRLLNNCLKHSSTKIVTKKLEQANNNRWKRGEKIVLERKDINLFLDDMKIFFKDLKKTILGHIANNYNNMSPNTVP